MNKFTIQQLQQMRESEDRVEFKAGEGGNVSYDGRGKTNPKDRRRCILGYVVALCNEGGGRLVIGMHDNYPHRVTGTRQAQDAIGQLESDIYRDTTIRPEIYELYDEENHRVLLKELHDEAVIFNGKGGLGTSVEFFHYGYEPNSDAEPDFKEAGLELKCTPLKLLADNSMAAKERLVLNIINYIEEAEKSFETSSFWQKNKFLLLMFYLHQSGVNPVDMLFKLIRTWKFPNEDLKIITDDWNIIHNKILSGHAHELTEGETFYLAPCMKGSRAGEEMREQPFSDIPAQQRAYSLKQGYVNKIILASYLDETIQHQLKLSPRRVKSLVKKYSSEKVVRSTRSYKRNETFEELIERRMKPFYGRTVAKIEKKFKTEFNVNSKDFAYNVCRTILGIKTKKIEEFENAGVTMKSVVLEAKRDYARESMSFPYIRFTEIVNQAWDESDWYKTLSSKFLFAIFRKSPDGDKKKMKLEKVFFWNMPYADLCVAEDLWLDTQQKVRDNDYNNFITTKTHPVCHVRPHGTQGQTVLTPQGDRVQTKCFWLNNDYIFIIKSKLEVNE